MQNCSPGEILLVDDEIESLSGMRDVLSELGYRVKGCLSGGDALAALKERRCDILLTDLVMPDIDGITLMKRAKELDPFIICIMVTGHASIQTAVEVMKEGAFDYITKPYDWKMLRLAVSRALEVRRLMQSEEQMRISRDQWRTFARHSVEGLEKERQRIARELHDGVGQNLIALAMNLNFIRASQTPDNAGETNQRLNDALDILHDIKQTIRNVITDFRPPVLDDFGLLPAILSHSDKFSKHTGLHISVEGDEDMPRLTDFAEITLYRIVQEALTNVAKHAQARNVTICLKQSGAHVLLEIRDDGAGFDVSPSCFTREAGPWGLINMRERAESIGGTLRVVSDKGKGTRIIFEINR